MPRDLEPCGTPGAYKRHQRAGEQPCEACQEARNAEERARRAVSRATAASTMEEAIEDEPDIGPGLSELEDARENLRLVRAAMRKSGPRDMGPLSKRREELVNLIRRLESATAEKKVSKIDELARKRQERLTAAAN